MITGVIKNKIDKIWTDIWAGGITNPITVIEQLTYLMFMRSLIRKGAFENCESLKSIELPSTIEVIEEDAFYGCGDIEIKINKPEGSVAGAPWRADDAKVIWAK